MSKTGINRQCSPSVLDTTQRIGPGSDYGKYGLGDRRTIIRSRKYERVGKNFDVMGSGHSCSDIELRQFEHW